jgi:NADPH:quinone reductase-like Zn-dependent oxidoreductase
MSKEQTVYRLSHRRSFSGLTPCKEPIPSPSHHEVVIKTRSVALNYRDIAVATSTYPAPCKENGVPCSDAAGDIVSVGAGVQNLSVGDKVVAAFDPTVLYGPRQGFGQGLGAMVDGVLREYVLMPATTVVKVKQDGEQSYGEWASLVCTGVTCWNALYGNVPLKPGQVVLCQGVYGNSTRDIQCTG